MPKLVNETTMAICSYVAAMCNFRPEPYTVHQCAIVGETLEKTPDIDRRDFMNLLSGYNIKAREQKIMVRILDSFRETDSWILEHRRRVINANLEKSE